MLAGASNPRPIDRTNPPNALANTYRTADDRWLLLAFANENKQVPLFLKAIGHPEAAEDPRFKDSASRHAHAAEIVALLDKTFATRPLAEWREVLDGAGLTYGVVQTLEEAAHDPQFVADGVFVPVDDGGTDALPDHRQPRAAGPGAEGSPTPRPRAGRTHPGRAGRDRFRHCRDQGPGECRDDSTSRRRMSDPQATGAVSTFDDGAVQTRELDGILVITINRPKVRNAVDGATARALADAFDQLDARDDLAVGVLTGAGGSFSAGMDLKAYAAGDTPVIPGRGFAGLTRARPQTPLIAAVEGWALGGGTEMALACDLIVAAQDATFGLFEVTHGLVPPRGASCACPNASPATSPWNCCSPVIHCLPGEPSSSAW